MADWHVELASTMETGGEPWSAMIRVRFGRHTVWVELERDDDGWQAEIAEAKEECRGN